MFLITFIPYGPLDQSPRLSQNTFRVTTLASKLTFLCGTPDPRPSLACSCRKHKHFLFFYSIIFVLLLLFLLSYDSHQNIILFFVVVITKYAHDWFCFIIISTPSIFFVCVGIFKTSPGKRIGDELSGTQTATARLSFFFIVSGCPGQNGTARYEFNQNAQTFGRGVK
eukprot:c18098_g1_i1.p1 GENE.c18098_g1_i1~~c18098_g1_i1.p1  ORF type:complete len:168 (+),score=14.72 c18098_g1_i1:108-611(+)